MYTYLYSLMFTMLIGVSMEITAQCIHAWEDFLESNKNIRLLLGGPMPIRAKSSFTPNLKNKHQRNII